MFTTSTRQGVVGHVLVIDGQFDDSDQLAKFLRRRGYEVSAAANAEAALELIKEELPDIVLLDVASPKLNGLALLEQILEHQPNLAIITMAGAAEEVVARQSLELGASDFIAKPFNLRYLETALRAKLTVSRP